MNTFITLLTGGGLLVAGGILSAWQTNRFARKRDHAAHAHELEMSQEARRQDRLEQAYTDLGVYLSHEAAWARSVHPFMGPVPVPDPLSDDERWRIETLVTNHGSAEVRQLLDQWGEQRLRIQEADIVISMAEKSQNAGINDQARTKRLALEDDRKAMYETTNAIRDQMRKELAGKELAGKELAGKELAHPAG